LIGTIFDLEYVLGAQGLCIEFNVDLWR